MLVDHATRLAGHPSATALVEGDLRITYGELAERVQRTAAGLRARGLPTGALVALLAAPSVDGVVAYLGVQAAGLVPVMLSPRSPQAEHARRFDETEPALVVLGAANRLTIPTGVKVVRPAGSTAGDAEVLDGTPAAATAAHHDDPAVVLYTSGVGGLPKPVVLTYGNLGSTSAGLIAGPGAGLDHGTIAFAGLPLAHVFGLNSVVGTVLAAGGKLILHDGFDPGEVAELVARHRVTALSAVPLQWKALAALGDPELFATVTRATWSAAPMPPTVVAAAAERLGLRLAAGFGLSETAGTICHDDPTDPQQGTVGWALGDNRLRIVDESGQDALPGDVGEIWVKGPSVAHRHLDGSPLDVDADGWLRTGDVGVFADDGRLDIVDRMKDVINISGFNVSPSEVELALDLHPGVATCVVVGDLDEAAAREIVVAHVVRAPGNEVSESDLIEHCKTHLSRYKVPARILLHTELPLTESGKAVRRLLATA